MSNPEELDTRIQQLVEDTLQRHQEQTLAAATSVAETIASRFLDSQQSKIDKALESQKKLASVNLKGKGNQHQFNFCENVMDKFDKAADSLADKDIEKAQKLLSEGRCEKNKIINHLCVQLGIQGSGTSKAKQSRFHYYEGEVTYHPRQKMHMPLG
ncbi:uncharacterized protein LOC130645006 [Hydractinia symbiolongicarpus]|uniref:uncharacterized protein LOC130645006 n=1 Tax=Hydractinia symbiolongicarpus TaxID=13093 RepID=UPI00254DFB9A|nr:uncharacterized protein LOC130645006 [Hydractinia symbiolongicarpus]